MTVPPSCLKRLKWPLAFLLLTAGLTVLFLGGSNAGRLLAAMDCRTVMNLYEIRADGSSVLATGEYHYFTGDGGGYAKTTYIGNIIYRNAQGETVNVSAVNRETDARIRTQQNRVQSELTAVNSRFGDHCTEEQVRDYVFYHYTVGSASTSTLYWLDGTHLGSGPENFPRVVCQEV